MYIPKVARPARNRRRAREDKDKGVGVLECTVISADRLRAADRGGTSDPYVVLSCGAKTERTHTKHKTLSPVWDEAFALEVQPGVAALELNVYDEDKIGADSFLGSVCVRLDDLEEDTDVVCVYVVCMRSNV